MTTTRTSATSVWLDGGTVTTRVLDRGTGPVVVLLHGNPDNADGWASVIEALAVDHRCVAPDFPGYGEAELPAHFGYTLAEQVAFLDRVLDERGVDGPVTLVVHDTGGMVGTAWAAANIDRLAGVVVTNTIAFERHRWFPIARRWADESPRGRLRSALGMGVIGLGDGRLFRRVFGAQSPQLDGAQLERFAVGFATNQTAKRATLRQFRQFVPHAFFDGFDAMRAAIADAVPVEVVWGQSDPYIADDAADRFHTDRVRRLEGVGHWVPLVAPGEVAAAVRRVTGS